MQLKPGVNARLVHPGIWIFLGIIAEEHRRWTSEELWVTSLRRPPGGRVSFHAPKEYEEVRAADFRRHVLDTTAAAEAFCRMLQARFGRDLGVVLEPEWLTTEELSERGGVLNVDPHIHVQLKTSDYPRV
jgi:hypothetical protein